MKILVLKSNTILVIGAHPDDIELGCGGTVRVASKLGKKVIAVFMSKGEHKPETILTHTVNDIHQDHRQVGWASISAFRNAPQLLAYETPRVTPSFSPTYFVDISSCVDDKWTALKCHISQKTKRYITYESMVNLASFRGSQVSLPAAEAFEVVRYVERLPI